MSVIASQHKVIAISTFNRHRRQQRERDAAALVKKQLENARRKRKRAEAKARQAAAAAEAAMMPDPAAAVEAAVLRKFVTGAAAFDVGFKQPDSNDPSMDPPEAGAEGEQAPPPLRPSAVMATVAAASASAAPAPIRWAIVSCGKISHDFVNAIRHLSDVLIVACAARSLDDAQAFAKLFNIPRAYGSYAELVADASVQVCYIGSLHPQHADLSTLCLEGGKHVLCEKPFAVTARDAESVVALAHRKGLFVMEAMWSRFVPSIVRAREILASGVLGEVKVVQAPFGFRMAPDTPRLWENKHAGGATLDLGVYPIALASMVFSAGGTVEPSRITAAGELSQDEKIDTQLSITLQYGSGQMAVLHCSMLATLPNEAYIIGTRGWLRLDAHSHWHCTQRLTLHLDDQPVDQVFDFPEPKRADQFEFKFVDSQLMVHECREVNRCIRAGATESSVHSNREAIAIARIMDEVRRQVGVVYAEDKKQ